MKEKIELDKIDRQVEAAALRHYGSTFRFRPNQKEAIVNTIFSWLTGNTTDVILQGPTGSGKSAIGMLVAAVLSEDYGKTGYIVISDLSLIQQYERDCEKFFDEYAVLKGQQTYICNQNGLTFNNGTCKLSGCKSYGDIYKKFPVCSEECEYLLERRKAIKSPVVVCTYSFWLIQQNMVKPKVDGPVPFDTRDFVICDEAHKLVSIVQSHFSPALSESDTGKFRSVIESTSEDDISVVDNLSTIRERIKFCERNDVILDLLKEYVNALKVVVDAADVVKRDIGEKLEKGENLSKGDRSLVHNADFVEDHYENFAEYVKIIDKSGIAAMVKNPNGDKILFNCIDESYLMGKYFHSNCGYKMYMSATIGDPQAYANDISTNGFVSIDIPSTFDFTQSPIFYVNNYKLSYNDKKYTFPKIVDMIISVINMYAGKRGIVQTGSYEFAKQLLEFVPDDVRRRMIMYDGSREKDEAISLFKLKEDGILVGPTLVEGLSFDDDLCRFQIVMKVPYPSLADKFVKAKQVLKPEWYSNTTAISILQGVGRGIRSEKDWCVTFILDGCFTYLMQKSYKMFPKEFMNRIKTITPGALGCN